MNRRGFIHLLAGIGVAAASGNFLNRAVVSPGLAMPIVTSTRPMMGTYVSISVPDSDNLRASAAFDAAFGEMDRLEKILSRFRADSPVSKLNRDSLLPEAPPELLDVLSRARFFSDVSGGAFDATVEPIVDLIAQSFATREEPPAEDQIQDLLPEIDYHSLQIVGSGVQIRRGMGVTLDSIAKGYIIDRAIETLKMQRYEHAMVDAGGDLRALGDKAQGRGWRVGIRDPFGSEQDLIRVMDVTNRAVATSGDYVIFFDPEKKYFHIVNPKNGCCPQEVASATVVASNATDAGATATTIMVLGSHLGLDFVERMGAECFLVLRDGSTVESKGMKNFW